MIKKKSLINVIFGIGVGLILTGQSYPVRENRGDYLENNYNEYYDNRNYMMNYNMNGINGHHINPLYQYLQTQQAGYMYGGDPHRRY